MSSRLQMHIQKSVKNLRWSALTKKVNSFWSLNYFCETLYLRFLIGSEYASGLLMLLCDSKRDTPKD